VVDPFPHQTYHSSSPSPVAIYQQPEQRDDDKASKFAVDDRVAILKRKFNSRDIVSIQVMAEANKTFSDFDSDIGDSIFCLRPVEAYPTLLLMLSGG
jgi:hypothetical protein